MLLDSKVVCNNIQKQFKRFLRFKTPSKFQITSESELWKHFWSTLWNQWCMDSIQLSIIEHISFTQKFNPTLLISTNFWSAFEFYFKQLSNFWSTFKALGGIGGVESRTQYRKAGATFLTLFQVNESNTNIHSYLFWLKKLSMCSSI